MLTPKVKVGEMKIVFPRPVPTQPGMSDIFNTISHPNRPKQKTCVPYGNFVEMVRSHPGGNASSSKSGVVREQGEKLNKSQCRRTKTAATLSSFATWGTAISVILFVSVIVGSIVLGNWIHNEYMTYVDGMDGKEYMDHITKVGWKHGVLLAVMFLLSIILALITPVQDPTILPM